MAKIKDMGSINSPNNDKFFLLPESLTSSIGYEEALVLMRVKYWISVCGRPLLDNNGLWIYNSQQKWKEQFSFFSLYKVKKIIYSLEDRGLLISKKINAKKWNHTKWYTIDFDKFNSLLGSTKPSSNCFSSKSTNPLSDIEPTFNKQKTNYTNKSLYKEKHLNFHDNEFLTYDSYLKEQTNQSCNIVESLQNGTITEDTSIVKEMVTTWNEVFKYSLNPIRAFSNSKNANKLFHIYMEIFNANLEEWKRYALKVNSSKFLMGEKTTKSSFKAVFPWLIKVDTIKNILAGAYDIGDREVDINNIFKNIEKQKEVVVNTANNKIAEYIKGNISELEEKMTFNSYVLNKEYEMDNDLYGIKHWVTNNCRLSPYSLIHNANNKALYQKMFDSYIMKKWFGKTRRETQKELKFAIDKISHRFIGDELFEKLNIILNRIHTQDPISMNHIHLTNILFDSSPLPYQ